MPQSSLDKSGRAPNASDLDNDVTLNRPGSPTNTPQHLVSEEPSVADEEHLAPPPVKAKQTGEHTAPPDRDVADPHPADEEHYGRIRRPGGANPPPPNLDIGPDPERNDGAAPPPPANAERDKY